MWNILFISKAGKRLSFQKIHAFQIKLAGVFGRRNLLNLTKEGGFVWKCKKKKHGEMFIYGMHISPYEKGNIFNKDPLRPRKLLLHKKEIDKIFGKMKEKGNTVVPLQVYFNGSLVKVEVGLAKGKKLYDKRDDIAKKDQKREAQREFKIRNL